MFIPREPPFFILSIKRSFCNIKQDAHTDGFALVFVTVSYKKKKERRIVTMRNGGLDWEWGRRRLGPGQELGGSEPSRAILDLLKP